MRIRVRESKVMIQQFKQPISAVVFVIGWSLLSGGLAKASNPWASAIGDAACIQGQTEALANRLNRTYPTSIATQTALMLNNHASQLSILVRNGARAEEIFGMAEQVCSMSRQLGDLVHGDYQTRNDRSLIAFLETLDRKNEALHHRLDQCLSKLQPAVIYAPPRANPPNVGYGTPPNAIGTPNWSWRPPQPPIPEPPCHEPGISHRTYSIPVEPPYRVRRDAYEPRQRTLGQEILSGVLHELANRL